MPTERQNDELVMNLVEQALAQPAVQREAYLRSACGPDAELFEQVWNYVRWEERMDGFLLDPLHPLPVNEHPFQPGQLVDQRFRIVREVAQGGMGVVYEAVDEKLDLRIAIKCAKSGFHKRLPPEVRHAREVNHPNVCRTFEIHTARTDSGEVDFLTMEFVEGQTLAERLREGPLARKEASSIARQLCLGLAEAHRKQVVHGDLKTNNIILANTREGIRAVITDFGLARRVASQQAGGQTGELGGAPDYMAPELLKGGKPSAASDIYALGVILHEMASGRRPFGTETSWEQRLGGRPAPLKHRWHRVVARCLDPEPSRRWASVEEVANGLAPSKVRLWWGVGAAAAAVSAIVGAAISSHLTPPLDTVRLAMLPFQTDAPNRQLSNGLLQDTTERLNRVKRSRTRLTMIPVSDAVQNKVDRPDRAAKVLGATHTLTGTMRTENGHIFVNALLTEARTGVRLRTWQADYRRDELRNMPIALAGFVTGSLRLPPLAVIATVKPAAYVDFATGVSLIQRDTGVDAALPLLERAVRADPESPLTYARLAEAQILKYLLTEDPQWEAQGKASLAKAEQINPDVAVVRSISGIIHRFSGEYEQAEADSRRALDLEPGNGTLWRRLGKVYEEAGKFDEALAALQKAIEVQPGYFKNYQELCSLYSDQANYEEAVRQCQKEVQLAPDLWEAHFALSLPYLNWGKFREGESEARTAVRLQENSSRALHALAEALLMQDRNLEAIPYFRRAIQIGPASDLLYMNLGTSLRRAQFDREAKEAYREGLKIAEIELSRNARAALLHADVAYLCARLNQRNRAESEAGQASQLAHGSVEVAWMLVLTYDALADRERAIAFAQELPDDKLRQMNRFPDLADFCSSSRFEELMLSRHLQY